VLGLTDDISTILKMLAYQHRGTAHLEKKEYKLAIKDLNETLSISSDDPEVHSKLAEAKEGLRRSGHSDMSPNSVNEAQSGGSPIVLSCSDPGKVTRITAIPTERAVSLDVTFVSPVSGKCVFTYINGRTGSPTDERTCPIMGMGRAFQNIIIRVQVKFSATQIQWNTVPVRGVGVPESSSVDLRHNIWIDNQAGQHICTRVN
jgi:hypothetical protein